MLFFGIYQKKSWVSETMKGQRVANCKLLLRQPRCFINIAVESKTCQPSTQLNFTMMMVVGFCNIVEAKTWNSIFFATFCRSFKVFLLNFNNNFCGFFHYFLTSFNIAEAFHEVERVASGQSEWESEWERQMSEA